MNPAEDLQPVIRRLDQAARDAVAAADRLAVELEVQRDLAALDRVQIARLIILVQRLLDSAATSGAGVGRLEVEAEHVAEALAANRDRADHADPAIPGAGADAALRSPGAMPAPSTGPQPSSSDAPAHDLACVHVPTGAGG